MKKVLLFVALVAACGMTGISHAQSADSIAGFTLVFSEPGVSLYRKNRDYLHIIKPSEGGVLRTEVGPIVLSGGLIMHERRNVPAWWARLKGNENVVSVFNGQFFDANDADIAPLAFSTKVDGTVYRGYADTTEFKGAKVALLLGEQEHRVVPYRDDAAQLAEAKEQDAVVGLLWWADKRPRSRVPRTLVGVAPSGDTYVFVSQAATQRYALGILKRFGIRQSEIVMLDGGGSSQLSTRDGQLVPRRVKNQRLRKVPQVMVVEMSP